jgi:hypothetical protein
MNKRILMGFASLLALAPAVYGNPFDPNAPGEFSQIVFFALIAEVLVVSALLALRKFRFFRVFVAWLFVTQMTYWYLQGAMLLYPLIRSWDLLYDPYWLLLLVSEVLVVLIEAWIILRMSESRFFRDPETAFSKETALGISFAGNAVSLAISLVLKLP